MATSLRLLRINCPLLFNSTLRNTTLNGINRFIFTEASLGINGYNNSRSQIHQQFANVENSFRQKMSEIVKNENSVVFTEDLKAMIHLINNTSEDINLVLQMIHKFNNQNKELRFGTYVFGPVVMRAFYYLDEPDIALNTFLDTKLTCFFDQNMSYIILMTLLYKHERYSDLRKVYEVVKSRNIDIHRFPRGSVITLIAGCYKENTPESFQYALDTWKELMQKGFQPIRRVVTHIAGLAIKQNSPEIALEILSGTKTSRYIDNRCLKIVAYCKLNRLVDVIQLLRLSIEDTDNRKECYFSDVVEMVEKSAENADVVIKPEIIKLVTVLKTQGLVEPSTLEAHLLQPIERSTFNKTRDRRIFQSYNNNFQDQTKRKFGLKDLL